VYVLQRCAHSRFQLCEIVNIHAAQSVMTCVSPASLQRFRDIAHRVSGVNKSRFTRVKCGDRRGLGERGMGAVVGCICGAQSVAMRRRCLP
jgi:hypothetical protein